MYRYLFSAFVLMASATMGFAQTEGEADPDAAASAETPAAVVANGQTFGAWTVTCEAVAVGQTACLLNQTILRDTDRAFLAQVIALKDGESGKTFLLARVPLGASLPFGFAMRPEGTEDEESLLRFDWQTCFGQICEALTEIDADRLAQVDSEGTTMLASYQPALKAEPLVFRLSLQGARAGMDAIATAPQ